MSQLLSAVSLAARSSSLLLCILGCHAKFEKKNPKALVKGSCSSAFIALTKLSNSFDIFLQWIIKNLRKTSFSPYIAGDVIAVP